MKAKSKAFPQWYQDVEFLYWIALGISCMLYSIFAAAFAEWNVRLPFLNFPIFVGEILLAAGLLLVAIKWSYLGNFCGIKRPYIYLLAGYVVWILVKALWGYFTFGPLSFRHAALFYYLLFMLIGYSLFPRDLFKPKVVLLLLGVFFLTKMTVGFPYSLYPSFILYVLLAYSLWKQWPYLSAIFLISVPFLFYYKVFLGDSKTYVIGHITAFGFLLCSLFLVKVKIKYKTWITAGLSLIVIIGVLFYAKDKNKLRALSSPQQFISLFKDTNCYVESKKAGFEAKELSVSLYNPQATDWRDNAFLRSRRQSAILKLFDADVSKEEIFNLVNEQYDAIRVSVGYALNDAKQEVTLGMKNIIAAQPGDSEEKKAMIHKLQKKEIEDLEAKSQKIAAEIYQTIAEHRKDTIGRINNFLEENRLRKIPLDKLKGEIANIAIVSVYEEPLAGAIKDSIGKIYLTKEQYLEEIMLFVASHQRAAPIIKNIEETGGVATFDESKAEAHLKKVNVIKDVETRKELLLARTANMVHREIDPHEHVQLRRKLDSGEEYEPLYIRTVPLDHVNMLFRAFIWKDMWDDMKATPHSFLTGINIGKPQRSISNEILNVAMGEWTRDGWITPHNSYFHMIYRGGLIGLAVITAIGTIFITLLQQTVRLKSVVGLLLLSTIVYWLTISNFLVFLEIPYNAIPCWTLVGMTMAYLFPRKDHKTT